jgi:hypothetical protein
MKVNVNGYDFDCAHTLFFVWQGPTKHINVRIAAINFVFQNQLDTLLCIKLPLYVPEDSAHEMLFSFKENGVEVCKPYVVLTDELFKTFTLYVQLLETMPFGEMQAAEKVHLERPANEPGWGAHVISITSAINNTKIFRFRAKLTNEPFIMPAASFLSSCPIKFNLNKEAQEVAGLAYNLLYLEMLHHEEECKISGMGTFKASDDQSPGIIIYKKINEFSSERVNLLLAELNKLRAEFQGDSSQTSTMKKKFAKVIFQEITYEGLKGMMRERLTSLSIASSDPEKGKYLEDEGKTLMTDFSVQECIEYYSTKFATICWKFSEIEPKQNEDSLHKQT